MHKSSHYIHKSSLSAQCHVDSPERTDCRQRALAAHDLNAAGSGWPREDVGPL